MQHRRRTIDEIIFNEGDDTEQVIYFKTCEMKIWGFSDDKKGNTIYTNNPNDPNASRDYEAAMVSHEKYSYSESEMYRTASSDPETDDDRRYNPDVYKEVEEKLLTAKTLPIPPKLNKVGIIQGIAEAPSSGIKGFLSMFKPSVFWNYTDKWEKIGLIFASYQFLALFVPGLFRAEYYVLWIPLKFMFLIFAKVFVSVILLVKEAIAGGLTL